MIEVQHQESSKKHVEESKEEERGHDPPVAQVASKFGDYKDTNASTDTVEPWDGAHHRFLYVGIKFVGKTRYQAHAADDGADLWYPDQAYNQKAREASGIIIYIGPVQ